MLRSVLANLRSSSQFVSVSVPSKESTTLPSSIATKPRASVLRSWKIWSSLAVRFDATHGAQLQFASAASPQYAADASL